MVALTGVEPAVRQFSSVQLSLSGCGFSTVGIPRCSETLPRTTDVVARSWRTSRGRRGADEATALHAVCPNRTQASQMTWRQRGESEHFPCSASALARRSCPGLLTKTDPPKRQFGAGRVRGLDAKESPATGLWMGYKDLARLRRG